METTASIESGILELYVYGLLSESENEEIAAMAKNNPEINNEIIAIEKTIIALTSSFSPFHSVANYEKTKAKLVLNNAAVTQTNPSKNWSQYIAWVATVFLLAGIIFQYSLLNQTTTQVANTEIEKAKLKIEFNALKLKNAANTNILAIVRDPKNTVVALSAQAGAPESSAKVYWNQNTKVVFIDAAALPAPPQGMVYQVWALKLSPLTPTSIGLLQDFNDNELKLFVVNNTNETEAFGITLEPTGGSLTPTMKQLYALGKV